MVSAGVTFAGGMKFLGTTESGHQVTIDAAPEVGGDNAGARPMEMTLMALGGCSGIDVMSILNKMRVALDHFSIDFAGERRDEHPRVFVRIVANYRFRGPDEATDKMIRAVHLSQEKYCSVSAMLATTAVIEANIFVNDQLVERFEHKSSSVNI